MWFAVPQTSRDRAGSALENFRTHALCGKRHGMARPTKPDKRDHQLNIKLTALELCWVRSRADSTGLRPGEYGRAQVLADRPVRRSAVAAEGQHDPLFMAQLSRLGNNLNQIARALHELGIAAPSDLAPLLAEIRCHLARGGQS